VTQLCGCAAAVGVIYFKWDHAEKDAITRFLVGVVAWAPPFAVQSYAGHKFATLLARIQTQHEIFDVRNAEASVESDKDLLYAGIKKRFGDNLDSFNTVVRTTLKSATLRSLTGQGGALGSWGILLQQLWVGPVCFSLWSFEVRLRPWSPPEWAWNTSHFIETAFLLFPLMFAAARALGKRCASVSRSKGAWAAIVHVGVGFSISAFYVADLCFWRIMSKDAPFLVRRAVHAIRFGLLATGAWWTFGPRAAPAGSSAARKFLGAFALISSVDFASTYVIALKLGMGTGMIWLSTWRIVCCAAAWRASWPRAAPTGGALAGDDARAGPDGGGDLLI